MKVKDLKIMLEEFDDDREVEYLTINAGRGEIYTIEYAEVMKFQAGVKESQPLLFKDGYKEPVSLSGKKLSS